MTKQSQQDGVAGQVLATKLEDLGLISGMHITEGRNQLRQTVPEPPHVHHGVDKHTHIHISMHTHMCVHTKYDSLNKKCPS